MTARPAAARARPLDSAAARVYREAPPMCTARPLLALAVLGSALAARPAVAAFPTRVLTAVEKETPLPDVALGVTFDRNQKRARITREWIQDQNGRRTALDVRELDFEELTQRMVLELRVGIFRDLEFRATAPVVLQNDSELRFAEGVESQSTIWGSENANDPATDLRYPLTEVPGARERSGFGDMTFGLAWSPFVDAKDESYPTFTLRGDVTVPTGALRDPADQDALPAGATGDVGRGMTVFDLALGFSRRMRSSLPTLEPYMLLGARLPVASPRQRDRGMEPPIEGYLDVGTEIVFHEDLEERTRFDLELAFRLRYTSVGRTYSELSDYLPSFDQTRAPANRSDPSLGEDAIVYSDFANPGNYAGTLDGARCGLVMGVACGELNRVEEHLGLGGTIALHLQPSRFLLLRGGLSVNYTTDHFLTTERVGVDTDPVSAVDQECPEGSGVSCVGRVNARNSAGNDERSPYYDPRYDAPGRRLRAEGIVDLTFFLTAAATF
jgi:hypothetical protein